MKRTAVINVVGLTRSVMGSDSPAINRFAAEGSMATIVPSFPAVTCTAQSTYVTGTTPASHGIVANGWYNREMSEVQFWKQSNHLVQQPKIWDELRKRGREFTCAKLFWWYNMYSTADYSITPRPIYPADGRKVFDVYTAPMTLGAEIKKDLGAFPFPTFWGPAAGISTPQGGPDAASRWIAASARWIETRYEPTLNLVYLPHLDYNLQRLGPGDPRIAQDVRAVDEIVGELLAFFAQRGVQVLLLSEYGISEATSPVHLNRRFREQGWLTLKEELGLELMDCGASKVFAVADHQVAHVYVQDTSLLSRVRQLLEREPGVGQVLDAAGKQAAGLDHPRAGDLVALAAPRSWFTYYYWLDDSLAPDFARCVDIHRKPGYDPVELFLNPALLSPKLTIAWKLLRKKLGFRMLMDVIPLDATLVRGSHGLIPADSREHPVCIGPSSALGSAPVLAATDVYHVIKRLVLDEPCALGIASAS